VQNLMALRFANALYEPLWNSAHIDHVQITVAESVGLEGRAGYYDKAGALRDMVQNHLVQLLCLVAMEPPSSMDAEAVRDEKLKVLRSLKPINEDNADTLTVRGQYKAGRLGGRRGEGLSRGARGRGFQHRDLRRHQGGNQQLALGRGAVLSQHRQADERAGLGDRGGVQADPAFDLRPSAGRITANKLVMRLQPDEGVKQWIMIKDPGPGGMRLGTCRST
jgi:glucose-6-phosphate 1-dehydrogenase